MAMGTQVKRYRCISWHISRGPWGTAYVHSDIFTFSHHPNYTFSSRNSIITFVICVCPPPLFTQGCCETTWNKQNPLRAGQNQHPSVNCAGCHTFSLREALQRAELSSKSFKFKSMRSSENEISSHRKCLLQKFKRLLKVLGTELCGRVHVECAQSSSFISQNQFLRFINVSIRIIFLCVHIHLENKRYYRMLSCKTWRWNPDWILEVNLWAEWA